MSILDQFRQAIQGMNMGFQNTVVKPAQKAIYNFGVQNPQVTSQLLRTTQPVRQQPVQLKPFQSQPIQSNPIRLQPFGQNSAPSASLRLKPIPIVSKPIDVQQLQSQMKPKVNPILDTIPASLKLGKANVKGGSANVANLLLKTTLDRPLDEASSGRTALRLMGLDLNKLLPRELGGQKKTMRDLLMEQNPEAIKNLEKPLQDLYNSASEDYKKGQEMASKIDVGATGDWAKDLTNPAYIAKALTLNAPSFATSILTTAAVTFLTKNPMIGLTAGYGSSYVQNSGDVYLEAKNLGANEQTARETAHSVGAVNAILDTLSIGKMLKILPGEKQVRSLIIKQIFKDIAGSMATEATTESMQQLIQNSAAKVYYDHQRDLFAGIPESFVIGGIMGGVGGGGGSVLSSQMAPASGQLNEQAPIVKSPLSGSELEQLSVGPQDIIAKKPDINTKRDISVTDIYGNKSVIPAGEALTPYELTGNKVLLKDGVEIIVNKNQYQNVQNNAVKGEAQPFAPELEQTTETVKGFQEPQIRIEPNGKNWIGYDQNNNVIFQLGASSAKTAEEALAIAKEDVKTRPFYTNENDTTKYKQYTLPGGENYREVLIQAPTRDNAPYMLVQNETGNLIKEFPNAEEARNFYTTQVPVPHDFHIAPKDIHDYYQSSHWSEPNVLAHVRLNDRTYNDKKVTFIEELQSDWAGALRKDQNGRGLAEGTVPNSPLLKNWQELAIKRALQQAVNDGSEYLSWTTGEQQAARYNLAKYVDNILWTESLSGRRLVQINPVGSSMIELDINASGKILAVSQSGDASWIGKNLDEAIGKGIAEKIIAQPKGTIPNSGLKLGGEWAGNLYDKQIKNIVEDITGGKVENIDLKLPSAENNADMQWGDENGIGPLDPNKIKAGQRIRPQGPSYISGDMAFWKILSVEEDGKFVATPDLFDRQNVKLKSVSPDRKTKLYIYDDGTGNTYESEASSPEDFFHSLEISLAETFDIGNPTVLQQALKITPEIKARILGQAPALKQASGKTPFQETAQPTSKASDFNMTKEEARIAIGKILSGLEYEMVTGKKLTSSDGLDLRGKYWNSIVSLLEKNGMVEDKTVYHEAFHAYVDKLANPESYKAAVKEIMAEKGITEAEAREALPEAFADFMSGRQTFTGQALAFFQDILARIKNLIGRETAVRDFFNQARQGKQGEGMGALTEQGFQARQMALSDVAKIAYDNTIKNEGVTINLKGIMPEEGFAVSPFKERELIVPKESLDTNTIITYLQKNDDKFSQVDNFLGMWYNKKDGKVYIDVSVVKKTEAEANQIAKDSSQLAFTNLKNFEEIPTKYEKNINQSTDNISREDSGVGTSVNQGSGVGTELESFRRGAPSSATLTTEKSKTPVAPADFPRRPGEVNVNYLKLTKAQKKHVRDLGEVNDVETLTNDEVLNYAETAGFDMKSWTIGDVKKIIAERLNTRRQIIELELQADTLKKAKAPKKQIVALENAIADKSVLVAGQARAEGQMLAARKILADEINTPRQKIFQLLEEAGVKKEKYIELAADVDFNNPDEVMKFYRTLVPATFGDWIDKIRYNAMLSSLNTHIINITSNIQGTGFLVPIDYTIQGAIDKMVSALTGKERTRYTKEGLVYFKSFWMSQEKALTHASDILLHPENVLNNDNFDPRMAPLTTGGPLKIVENILDIPGRLLAGEDALSMKPAEQGQLAVLRYRESKGVKIKNLEENAKLRAKKTIFRGDLYDPAEGMVLRGIGYIGAKLKMFTYGATPGPVRWTTKFSLPFINIATNLAKIGFESNPLTGTLNLIGNKDKTSSISKMVMGGAFTLGALALAAQGRLTGAEDKDKTKRDAARVAGILPWSIRLSTPWGEQYVQFSKMHPVIGFQLGMIAAMQQAWQEGQLNEDKAEVMIDSLAKTLQYFNDQTYWRNVGDFVSVVNGDAYQLSQLVSNYPTQLIPFRALMTWATRIVDEYQRVPDPDAQLIPSVIQRIQAQIPYLSEQVPIKKDIYGTEIKQPNRLFNLISPYKTSPLKQEEFDIYGQMKERAVSNKILKQQSDATAKQNELLSLSTPQDEKNKIKLQLSKDINRNELKIVNSPSGAGGQGVGEVSDGIFQFYDKSAAEVKTIDLNKVLQPEEGIGKIKQQNNIYKSARDIWNSDLPQEQKAAAFKILDVNPLDVRYDALASYTEKEKTLDFLTKSEGKEHDWILERLLTGRQLSLSEKQYINDAVLKDIYESGLISRAEYLAIKKITYDKNGKQIVSRGSGKISLKAFPKYPSIKEGTQLKLGSNFKTTPIKIRQANVTKAKLPALKQYVSTSKGIKMTPIRIATRLNQLGQI
ncbi:hypothetical protein M0R04_15110 [Candidatus Dojkabacteria bacterium]|jgi:hypothetical protein|nr:hypothetical protein [Candidatus Dojkabacteria bacterium]